MRVGMGKRVEVFNMFSALIPRVGLTWIEKERQRQDRTDFKIYPVQWWTISSSLAFVKGFK